LEGLALKNNPQGKWLYKIVYEEPRKATREIYFRVVAGSSHSKSNTPKVEVSEWISGSCISKDVYLIETARGIWDNHIGYGFVPSEPEEYLAGDKSPLHTSHTKAEYLRNGNREVKKSFEKRMMNE